jgi:hypothetical protein
VEVKARLKRWPRRAVDAAMKVVSTPPERRRQVAASTGLVDPPRELLS